MGREISEQFFLGIQLEYYYLYIQNLGSDGTFGIGWGGIYQPFHNLSCGILMRNVNRAKIGACQENLPVIIQGGLAYRVEPDFILIFDIFKDKLFPAEPRLGMEYSHFKNFVIRLGVAQQPISLSAGFDIKVNRIVLSYAFNTHNQLGFTHTFQLSFNFGENRLIE
jgi:hypothetical protein